MTRAGRSATAASMTFASATSGPAVGHEQYAQLLDFRDGIRRFLNWSETQARKVGLTAAQHQLLLAIRGHRGSPPDGTVTPPTISDVAAHLMLRHHSAVELVGRALAAGLVERIADETDHRVVRLTLSADGERRLAALSQQHLEELRRLAPQLRPLWAGL